MRRVLPRGGRAWLQLLLVAVPLAFFVTTIPGVRSHPGYSLKMDGWLNNIAYMTAPMLCYLRLRKSTSYRASWLVLTAGLALYGLGNIYWTIAIRPLAVDSRSPPSPTTCGSRSTRSPSPRCCCCCASAPTGCR